MKELNNGLELLLTAQLFLELADNYKLKGISKRYCNLLVKELERVGNEPFDQLYKSDEFFAVNALNKKHDAIKIMAKYNEADAILFEEFVVKFDNNIELARKKGVSFFEKLL